MAISKAGNNTRCSVDAQKKKRISHSIEDRGLVARIHLDCSAEHIIKIVIERQKKSIKSERERTRVHTYCACYIIYGNFFTIAKKNMYRNFKLIETNDVNLI